jgi:phosphatidylglycerol---prolipoprotein diacylglyceryl transferase
MFIHNINPVLLNIGSLQVRYYGLLYSISFILAYFLINWQKKDLDFDTEDYLFYLLIGTLVGARLFYVLFYNLPFYIANPLKIIAVWQGGLSFHGGLLGAFATAYIFSKRKNIPLLKLADLTSIPLALGLFLGRIGNFINGELYGRITNVPWCFNFKNVEGCRHPSQIYESLKNLLIFFILIIKKDHKHKDGYLFSLFLILYSILRFSIEFIREPEITIASLTMGQWLTIPIFIIGLILYKKTKN